jgi:predicted metalloendopeptidase
LRDADRAAREVFALETAVAGHHWDKVTSRDREKTYNLFTWSGLLSEGRTCAGGWQPWTRRLAPSTRSYFASRALRSRMQRARLA